jgi:transposase InsO family protein
MKVSRSGFYDYLHSFTNESVDSPEDAALKAKASKRYKVATDGRHSFPIAPNLLDRKFNVDKPNTVWTTDITYV